MKKDIKNLLATALFLTSSIGTFAGVLKVGASPVPHAELLNLVKDDLKKEGVDLKVIEFADYITPNLALESGDIDANYFQNIPYLKKFNEEKGTHAVVVGEIHVEALGFYLGKGYKKIDALPDKATIAVPNDPTNLGRALILLHNGGVIKIKDPKNLLSTEFDIVSNPKKLKIKPVEAAQLPRLLKDVEGAVINGNYAIESGLNPKKDAAYLEGSSSPYINVVAVKKGNENNADIKKLVKALRSDKVKKYLNKKYPGSVIPVF